MNPGFLLRIADKVLASTPEAFAKFVDGEMKRWGKLVRDYKTKTGE